MCDKCGYYKDIHSGIFYCDKYKLYSNKTLRACLVDKANAVTNKINDSITDEFKRVYSLRVFGK